MINKVVLIGRLTSDPVLRTTASNKSFVSFTIAVDDRRTKNQDGTSSTLFMRCTAWNALAENINKYTKKGSLIGVDGRLVQNNFKRKDGTNGSTIDLVCENVEFLTPKGASTSSNEPGGDMLNEFESNISSSNDNTSDVLSDITEDDLPF